MYYIDIIRRQYPYEMMGMDKDESYEFYRNKLLEHYMPGLNGQCMSEGKAIEAAGIVLNEMVALHEDRCDHINSDLEIHLYAEWLKINRHQFWSFNIDNLARILGNGIYTCCRNHKKENSLIISESLLIAIEQLPWIHR